MDEDDWDRKVAMGPRKPGRGKTNSYTIDLMKSGKSVKNKLGNIFFEASQAMNIFNTISKEYSDRENIIYSNPSFVVEKVGNIAQSLLPYKLPDNTVVGYLGSYQKDKVINAAVQGGTL